MTATYRLQLHPGFGFAEAEAVLPYLHDLGVSHVYLSPITEARAGSTHGYDVIDHNAVREEFGGRAGLDRLLDAVEERGMMVILDWVPNHAGVGPRNAYWQHVLAFGPHSPYARYFDIDWRPLKKELHDKVLLPFLGRPYGEALDGGEFSIGYEEGSFYLEYFENRFALCPTTYQAIIEAALPVFERTDGYWDLKSLHEAYEGLGHGEVEKSEALRSRLVAVEDKVGPSAWPQPSAADLHTLMQRQWWRLAYWKTAGHEINYRRFFDINELVGLRMEDEQVFWDAHRLLGELLPHPAVAGVRIDHIDGMTDPHGYLENLRALGARHIWVEKILAHGEVLPEDWPVDGTIGYAFMNDVMRVLIDPSGEEALDRTYRRYIDRSTNYDDLVHRAKRMVMRTSLSSELSRLANDLNRISEADYHTRDFTLQALREALREVVAAFERYRTYVPHDPEQAREIVRTAVEVARRRTPAVDPSVYDFIERIITGEVREDLRTAQEAWVKRFQQYTAPVAAKGVEDTAFYRYHRLCALNEVGGEPNHFAVEPQAFHAHARFRAHRYPLNFVATATHDHKRGEDTRARLIAIAEVTALWDETIASLETIATDHRGHFGPDRNLEYLLFQILASQWSDVDRDALPDRLVEYAVKAAREAKEHTSWINPDEQFEADLETFVRGFCCDDRMATALSPIAGELASRGFDHAISQLIIKLTTPGVPDFYQGTELLDLSLVDPDNRREVDFKQRASLLGDLRPLIENPEPATVEAILRAHEPQAKFYVMARLLKLRRDRPALFSGDYQPLTSVSSSDQTWLAFARRGEDDAIAVFVPRATGLRDQSDSGIELPAALSRRPMVEWLTGSRLGGSAAIDPANLPLPWALLVADT